MQVRADVDALGAEAGLGDRGVGRLEVRGRDLVAGALGGASSRPSRPVGRWERLRSRERRRARCSSRARAFVSARSSRRSRKLLTAAPGRAAGCR